EPEPARAGRHARYLVIDLGVDLAIVRSMTNYHAHLNDTFHALADPTRRAVLASLTRGPASVSDLAEPFDMEMPTLLQHLLLLEDSGLIRSRKTGRVRSCELRPKPLADAERWMTEQLAMWTRRLDQLDDFLLTMHNKETRK